MSREAGKGSTYRTVNLKRFNENWDRIFGERPIVCPLPSCGCGHKNLNFEFGCDKGDKACALRMMDTFYANS